MNTPRLSGEEMLRLADLNRDYGHNYQITYGPSGWEAARLVKLDDKVTAPDLHELRIRLEQRAGVRAVNQPSAASEWARIKRSYPLWHFHTDADAFAVSGPYDSGARIIYHAEKGVLKVSGDTPRQVEDQINDLDHRAGRHA